MGHEISEDKGALRWASRPLAAFLVRGAIWLAPLLAGVSVSVSIASITEAPPGWTGWLMWFFFLGCVSTGTMIVVGRATRRLMPLAVLLRLSLIFPDAAPSRFGLALRSNNSKALEAKLHAGEELGSSTAESAESILVLLGALSRHDRATRGHSERVRAYAALIGEEMGLSDDELSKLQWSALIHDVGKLAVPAEILNKPGRLTDEEFEIIKTHPEAGAAMIAPLRDWLGEWSNAVVQHHERVDGRGYPYGLKGEEISLGARIVSVADVFDVITATRSYKTAQSPTEARRELQRHAGTQFDPAVVRAFLNVGLGRVRNRMWPLSWIAHVPFIGTAVTAPATTVVATGTVALSTAMGGTMVVDGMTMYPDPPPALAFVAEEWSSSDDLDAVLEIVGAQDPSVPQESDAPSGDDPAAGGEDDLSSDTTVPVVDEVNIFDNERFGPTTTSTPPVAAASSTTTASASVEHTTPATSSSTTTTTITSSTMATTTTVAKVSTTTTTAPEATTTTADTGQDAACEQLASGERDLSGLDLSGCSFSGLKLAGYDLSGSDLSGVDLSGLNLSGADLRGAVLYGTDLGGAQLSGVELDGAELSYANLANAQLRGVSMIGARFVGAELGGAAMQSATLSGADLTGAGLAGVDFRGATLTDVTLAGADLSAASLQDANLTGGVGVPTVSNSTRFSDTTCPDGSVTDVGCW